jgi:4-amino-4-deoxy-L-arabinose transferase-like glycosyltransferase
MPELETKQEAASASFSEAILGRSFFDDRYIKRLAALSPKVRMAGIATLLGAVLVLPYLGAVGLWDPWETHYGEVARQMIQRNDYVYPYWENGWMFSKPAMTYWLSALGMKLVGANSGTGPLGLFTEWGMRLPFAALSIASLVMLSLAVGRLVSRRAGLATAFVLATMPMYFLVSRQAVTDTPCVAAMVAALSSAMIGQLDETTRHRAAWWYAFYVSCAIATLAKGIVGIGFPAAVLVLYAVLSVLPWSWRHAASHVEWLRRRAVWPGVAAGVAGLVTLVVARAIVNRVRLGDDADQLLVNLICAAVLAFVAAVGAFVAVLRWRSPPEDDVPPLWAQFFKMRLGTGILVFFAITLPWYLTLTLFDQVGNQEEGQLFWFRFFVHDHLNRLTTGVHTTTPGGTFTYFIEQGGFAIFPWVALVPGAIAVASRVRLRSERPADHVSVIATLWVVVTFSVFGLSATKYHHYVFPILPALAVLIAIFVDRLWEEGTTRHAVPMIFGLVLFALVAKDLASYPKNFTDLFVYNYERPYPFELVTRPLVLIAGRALWWGDLLSVLLLAFGGYLTYDAFTDKTRPVTTRAIGLGMLLCGAALLLVVWLRGRASPTLLLALAILFTAVHLGYEASRRKRLGATLWTGCGVVAAVGIALLVRGATLTPSEDPLLGRMLETVNLKTALGFVFMVAALLMVISAAARARTMLFGTFWALAFGFALWFSWNHWVDLTHHWTQRDLFWKYYELRKPDEPIAAYLMNWRGETFYSRNQVKQIKEPQRLTQYANQPGREWALVEHNRLGLLKTAVGSHTVTAHSTAETNNKFVLVSIE